MMSEISIRAFCSADTDWLVESHQSLYSEGEGFDDTFGPLVRSILEAFLASHDPTCEAGWVAERNGSPLGSIFCVRHAPETAKLRLFLILPEARGAGLGHRLLTHCMGFAQEAGYKNMTLWTHESHQAACALYVRHGWTCIQSKPVHSFGCDLVEQTWTYEF